MEHQQYVLKQNGTPLFTGNEWDVREKIEELLEQRVGFFVSLQENTEEPGEYHFYLHSDNDEDMTEEDIETLNDHYGINTIDDENSEFMIKQLLNIEVEEA